VWPGQKRKNGYGLIQRRPFTNKKSFSRKEGKVAESPFLGRDDSESLHYTFNKELGRKRSSQLAERRRKEGKGVL